MSEIAGDLPPPGYSGERGPDGHFIPLVQGIVEATGAAVGRSLTGDELVDRAIDARAKRIEAAMTAAIVAAQAEGISDPDAMRARILAARDEAAAV